MKTEKHKKSKVIPLCLIVGLCVGVVFSVPYWNGTAGVGSGAFDSYFECVLAEFVATPALGLTHLIFGDTSYFPFFIIIQYIITGLVVGMLLEAVVWLKTLVKTKLSVFTLCSIVGIVAGLIFSIPFWNESWLRNDGFGINIIKVVHLPAFVAAFYSGSELRGMIFFPWFILIQNLITGFVIGALAEMILRSRKGKGRASQDRENSIKGNHEEMSD